MPATFKATQQPFYTLCTDHAIFAFIAGWEPREIATEAPHDER